METMIIPSEIKKTLDEGFAAVLGDRACHVLSIRPQGYDT